MADEAEIKIALDILDALKSMQEVSKASQKLEEKIEDDAKDASKEVSKQAKDTSKNYISEFKEIGKKVAVVFASITAGAVAVGVSVVKLAEDFSKLDRTLNAVSQYGEGGRQSLENITEFGTNLGVSLEEARHSAVRLMSAFDPASAEEVYRVIGDIAARSGLGAESIGSLGDMIVDLGNKAVLGAGDFEAFANQSGISFADLVDSIASSEGKTSEQIQNMINEGKIGLEGLLGAARDVASGGGVSGATALTRAAGDPAVQIAKLTTLWQQFREQLSQQLFTPEVVASLTNVVNVLAENLPGAVDKVVGVFDTLKGVFDWFVEYGDYIAGAFATVALVLGASMLPALIATASALWATVAAEIAVAAPIVLIIAAIAALGVALVYIYKHWDEIWAKIKEVAIGAWEGVKSAFAAGWDWIKEAFSNGVDFIVGLWDSIVEIWDGAVDWFSDIGSRIMDGLLEGITGGIGSVMDAITGVGDGMVDGLKNILGIHSPSLVMKREIGLNSVYGIEEGLEEGIRHMDSIDDITNRMLPGSNEGSSVTTTNNNAGTSLTFNFNGPTDASTQESIKEQINQLVPTLVQALNQRGLVST